MRRVYPLKRFERSEVGITLKGSSGVSEEELEATYTWRVKVKLQRVSES